MLKTVTVPPVFKLDCCKVGYVVAYGPSHKGVLADADSILARTTSPPSSKVSLFSSFLCSSAVPPLCVDFTSDRHCHIYSPRATHLSPSFLILFDPSSPSRLHALDSGALPHNGHAHHEPFVFEPNLRRRGLTLGTNSPPCVAMNFVWRGFPRASIVLPFQQLYYTDFGICLSFLRPHAYFNLSCALLSHFPFRH